eukprot:1188259-Prorocentrum_minimum.AAC.3
MAAGPKALSAEKKSSASPSSAGGKRSRRPNLGSRAPAAAPSAPSAPSSRIWSARKECTISRLISHWITSAGMPSAAAHTHT